MSYDLSVPPKDSLILTEHQKKSSEPISRATQSFSPKRVNGARAMEILTKASVHALTQKMKQFETTHPELSSRKYKILANTPNAIFLELPPGKIGKDGHLTIQKAQKGQTCFFYALRRILTVEQIRSEHGKRCSALRKELSFITTTKIDPKMLECFTLFKRSIHPSTAKSPTDSYSGEDWIQLANQEQAITLFLKNYELTILQAALLSVTKSAKILLAQNTPRNNQGTKEIVKIMEPLLQEDPKLRHGHTYSYVQQLISEKHGLKQIYYSELKTLNQLIDVLKTKGPLLISGFFGHLSDHSKPLPLLKEKIGEHNLYQCDDKMALPESDNAHVIVVIGAEKKNGKEVVYWICPEDPNDPKDLNAQRTLVCSFETFLRFLISFDQIETSKLTDKGEEIAVVAFYNPFAYTQTT